MNHVLKEVPEATPEGKAAILAKAFMTRDDLKALLGLRASKCNLIWNHIRDSIRKEFKSIKDGPILPDSSHLPTALVLKRLAPYGITRSQFERR